MTVAETILNQLGGIGRLVAMLGAKTFVSDIDSVKFRYVGNAETGNLIRITLDPSDTYTVELWWCRGTTIKQVMSQSMIYADQLRGVLESATGMRLAI